MSEQAQPAGQDNTAPQAQGDAQAQPASTLLSGTADSKPDAGQPSASAPQDGNTDAAKPDGDQNGDKPDGDKDKAAEGAPEKYELKAPEGFESLDSQLVETFEPLAKELNLSNDKAQKLVETMMPKVVERISEQHREAWGKQLETWVSDVKADKEIGGEALPGSLEAAKRAIDKFATPELKALIDYPSKDNPKGLGLGNHPELVRVFARIGKAMAEDTFENGNGNGAGQARDAAEVLYGGKS